MRHIGLAVLLVLVFAAVAASEEVKGLKAIGEYPIGEFAVKGEVERQLSQLVKEIKEKTEKGGRLQITVIGSADSTGVSAANDRLAKDRAEQVAAVLAHNFRQAKINVWSKGDAENVRQVRVEWDFIPISAATTVAPTQKQEPAKEKFDNFGWLVMIILVALIATVVLIMSVRSLFLKTKVEPEIQWIKDLDVGNERYYVKIEVKNGVWHSPFTSKSGTQICRDSRRGLIESLKGCLKKDEFRTQRDELIRNGKIRVLCQR